MTVADLLTRFAKTGVLPDAQVYEGYIGYSHLQRPFWLTLDPTSDLTSSHGIVVMLNWLEGQGYAYWFECINDTEKPVSPPGRYAMGIGKYEPGTEDEDGSKPERQYADAFGVISGENLIQCAIQACIAVFEAKDG